MPSIYQLKPAFQKQLQPVLIRLHDASITANQLTIAALALSATGGFLLWQSAETPVFLLTLPVILLIRMALNALDGMMARQFHQQSKLGAVLNELGDVVSDTVLYLPLIHLLPEGLTAQLALILFVILSVLTEFSGILMQALTGTRRYDGPMGKSDRAFLISLICLALYWIPPALVAIPVVLWVANLLLLLSCLNRLKAIREQPV